MADKAQKVCIICLHIASMRCWKSNGAKILIFARRFTYSRLRPVGDAKTLPPSVAPFTCNLRGSPPPTSPMCSRAQGGAWDPPEGPRGRIIEIMTKFWKVWSLIDPQGLILDYITIPAGGHPSRYIIFNTKKIFRGTRRTRRLGLPDQVRWCL